MEFTTKVKEALGAKKAGHLGTLDTNASGLMVICLDEGTKLLPFMNFLDKEYETVMKLHEKVEKAKIKKVFSGFEGEISQKPPVRSAVQRALRTRKVYSLKLKAIKGSKVYFTARVQSGTYIRKLCSDMGKSLGVEAQAEKIKRTAIGPFLLKSAKSLQNIKKSKEKACISIEDAAKKAGIKAAEIDPHAFLKLKNGIPLDGKDLHTFDVTILKGESVAIFDIVGQLLAMGTATDEIDTESKNIIYIKRLFN